MLTLYWALPVLPVLVIKSIDNVCGNGARQETKVLVKFLYPSSGLLCGLEKVNTLLNKMLLYSLAILVT